MLYIYNAVFGGRLLYLFPHEQDFYWSLKSLHLPEYPIRIKYERFLARCRIRNKYSRK